MHFPHAVIDRLDEDTDFRSAGFTVVNLDAANSHSHFQTAAENGNIFARNCMRFDFEYIKTTQKFALR